MTQDGDWRTTFRPDIPSAARVYDYLLGGKDNYPADRAVAKSMIAQLPNVQLAVRWNRAFLSRVVRYLIRKAGLRQIVDRPRRRGAGQRRRIVLLRRGGAEARVIRRRWRLAF
jgi:hypothetical protein